MKALIGILALAAASVALAQTENPNPRNFKLLLDGGEVAGVSGYSIDFERAPDIAYSPRRVAAPAAAPRLTLTLTPKGLHALSGWINEAGAGGSVAPHTVEVQALDNEGSVLVHWKLDSAQPIAVTEISAATGSVTATLLLEFQRLTLVSARAN
jgi:hypothetical protein